MALPKLDQFTHTHTVTLDADLDVCFQLRPIPGLKYQAIIDAHRGDDGKTPWEAIAVPILTAGIGTVYSSIESAPTEFTEDDATEIWTEWPEWARWDIYQAVIAYVTKGPAGNPFTSRKPNENAEP